MFAKTLKLLFTFNIIKKINPVALKWIATTRLQAISIVASTFRALLLVLGRLGQAK